VAEYKHLKVAAPQLENIAPPTDMAFAICGNICKLSQNYCANHKTLNLNTEQLGRFSFIQQWKKKSPMD